MPSHCLECSTPNVPTARGYPGVPSLLHVFTADVAVGSMLVRLLPFAATCALAFSVASAAEVGTLGPLPCPWPEL